MVQSTACVSNLDEKNLKDVESKTVIPISTKDLNNKMMQELSLLYHNTSESHVRDRERSDNMRQSCLC
jgi:hypothetical protein